MALISNLFNKLIFYLKVSRPGLWFATIWLYLLPTSQLTDIWTSVPFWIGFFFVSFPLNFLVYGWNDMVDREIDQVNPRKDSFLFGARGTESELSELKWAIAIIHGICLPVLLFYTNWKMLILFSGILIINGLYNLPKNGLRSRPPLELLCQVGYLLVAPFSILINDLSGLPWVTYFYLLLFAWQSHLIGEVMDIVPDRAAGRKTTATVIGIIKTKWLIISIVVIEVSLLFFVFKDFIFGGLLALGLIWLLLDLLFIYKKKQYTLFQMKLFGIMSNFVAVASMAYVWWSGCLL
jgi:4-hydroxybenzoate polyprenyltransferase and related prenyltransferases